MVMSAGLTINNILFVNTEVQYLQIIVGTSSVSNSTRLQYLKYWWNVEDFIWTVFQLK